MKMCRVALVLVLLLTGCAGENGITERGDYRVDTRHAAQNVYPRVRVLVMHYTAETFDRSLTVLTGKNVSVHYLIPERPPVHGGKPLVWQLAAEDKLTWHAGASFWRGTSRINDVSVGIELENPGYRSVGSDKQFYPFSDRQIQALVRLSRDIIQRNGIAPQNVVGHADIAPQRKDDPGPEFPWQALAQAGIGAWPDAQRVTFYLNGRAPGQPVAPHLLLDLLARYGYDITPQMTPEQSRRVISAFQMHFRPARYDGTADAQSLAIAEALLEKYGQG